MSDVGARVKRPTTSSAIKLFGESPPHLLRAKLGRLEATPNTTKGTTPSAYIVEKDYPIDCVIRRSTADCAEWFAEGLDTTPPPIANEATTWSIDLWRREYCGRLAEGSRALLAAVQDRASTKVATASSSVLFVDGREEAERYREFLLTVRASGYGGTLVFMTYLPEDHGYCERHFPAVFAPLECHYYPSPRWEWTLFEYHGIISYFTAYPHKLLHYTVAAVVRPDMVDWCGNPFDDMPPTLPTTDTLLSNNGPNGLLSGVRAEFEKLLTDVEMGGNRSLGEVFDQSSKALFAIRASGRFELPEEQRDAFDSFLIGSPIGMFALMKLTLEKAMGHERTDAVPSWGYLADEADLKSVFFEQTSSRSPLNNSHYDYLPPLKNPRCTFTLSSTSGTASPSRPLILLRGRHSLTIQSPPSLFIRLKHAVTYQDTSRTKHLKGKNSISADLLEGVGGRGSPIYHPFCIHEYRSPISEVPMDGSVSLKGVAHPNVSTAAAKIRAASRRGLEFHVKTDDPSSRQLSVETKGWDPVDANSVFNNPTAAEARQRTVRKEWGGFYGAPSFNNATTTPAVKCPHGRLVVVSMMGSYEFDRVQDYIGSFISYSDPICSTLVVALTWRGNRDLGGIQKAAALYPDRVEVAFFTTNESEWNEANNRGEIITRYQPGAGEASSSPYNYNSKLYLVNDYKDQTVLDQRLEVGRVWLEDHYHEYRYVMATDSRDFIFQGDPLKQLVKVLAGPSALEGRQHRQTDAIRNYLNDDFFGVLSENYGLGSFSQISTAINYFAREWLNPCGEKCYSYFTKQTYTNGEPFSTVNAGTIISSSVGMLHYYRLHMRMTIESHYGFESVGGTDQGLVTFYFHGILHDAGYPHKALALHSSRSGFQNPPTYHRLARRLVPKATSLDRSSPLRLDLSNYPAIPDDYEWEYNTIDCHNNVVTTVHQGDREDDFDVETRSNSAIKRPWKRFIDDGTFEEYFQI